MKTRDLEATSAFYSGAFGMALALDQGACRIFRARAGAYLGFCQSEGPTGSPEVIITLVVADVHAACAELERAGVQIEVRPRVNPTYQIEQFFARDPNGYLIEVQRFLDPRWKEDHP